jgi:hypothetical protein
MSKSLRERRREHALATIARLTEKRESIIASLVATDARLRRLHRQVARYDRAEAKPAAVAKPLISKTAAALPHTSLDDLGIPTFLQRQQDAETRDKAAAEAIRAEQAERKRNKTRVRIEEMKAKQSGATKHMPLQGKDALKAIYG